MSDYSSRHQNMSFLLREQLRRKLHGFALEVGDQLHGSCLLIPQSQWAELIPQAQFDAWITLRAWINEGESVEMLRAGDSGTGAETSSILHPSSVLDSRLRTEAAAYRLDEGEDWIVLARHGPDSSELVSLEREDEWRYQFPTLSYAWSILGIRAAGAIPLHSGSAWETLLWPTDNAVDPVTEQHRVLTKRVRTAFLAAMRAAARDFSRSPYRL